MLTKDQILLAIAQIPPSKRHNQHSGFVYARQAFMHVMNHPDIYPDGWAELVKEVDQLIALTDSLEPVISTKQSSVPIPHKTKPQTWWTKEKALAEIMAIPEHHRHARAMQHHHINLYRTLATHHNRWFPEAATDCWTWEDTVKALGWDPQVVCQHHRHSIASIVALIAQRVRDDVPLDPASMVEEDPHLANVIAAAGRIKTWPGKCIGWAGALEAAGLEPSHYMRLTRASFKPELGIMAFKQIPQITQDQITKFIRRTYRENREHLLPGLIRHITDGLPYYRAATYRYRNDWPKYYGWCGAIVAAGFDPPAIGITVKRNMIKS